MKIEIEDALDPDSSTSNIKQGNMQTFTSRCGHFNIWTPKYFLARGRYTEAKLVLKENKEKTNVVKASANIDNTARCSYLSFCEAQSINT